MLTEENLLKMLQSQARSAEMWIAEFRRHQDAAAVRNASLAIGKWFGLFNAMIFVCGAEKDIPDEVQVIQHRFSEIWDDIQNVQLCKH